MRVPFFSVEAPYRKQKHILERHLDCLFERCDFVDGALVRKLEEAVRNYTGGAKHAIAVGNASDGMACALQAAGIGVGDEVVVPAMTFVSSATSVVHVGARPVFADIDARSYSLDLDSVRRTITCKTRALMVVHLFHQPAHLPELEAIAQEKGLIIIEDSAESIGMRCAGRHTGLAGLLGIFSFFPTKTLGCFGDGGMIVTNDDAAATACRQLRDHGRQPGGSGMVLRPGHSSRMDSLQAAVLLARLETLEEEIQRRAQLAELYSLRLKELSPAVCVPVLVPRTYDCRAAFYVYVIQAQDRSGLASFLAAKGIETETYYPLPLHLQPAFAGYGYRAGDLPVAEEVCTRTLALPLYPGLCDEQVHFVCDAIAEFYRRRK